MKHLILLTLLAFAPCVNCFPSSQAVLVVSDVKSNNQDKEKQKIEKVESISFIFLALALILLGLVIVSNRRLLR